jgi:hypothetical protein
MHTAVERARRLSDARQRHARPNARPTPWRPLTSWCRWKGPRIRRRTSEAARPAYTASTVKQEALQQQQQPRAVKGRSLVLKRRRPHTTYTPRHAPNLERKNNKSGRSNRRHQRSGEQPCPRRFNEFAMLFRRARKRQASPGCHPQTSDGDGQAATH